MFSFDLNSLNKTEDNGQACHVMSILGNNFMLILYSCLLFTDPFLSGLGRAAEQVQKGVIPNKSRAEEVATQQFNAAKKEQSVSEQQKGSFFRRKRSQNQRRSKSLGKVGFFL